MSIRFGTDGVRGPAGVHPITVPVAEAIGGAAARLAREAGHTTVLVGRDTRPSGAELERAVAAGASRAGARCLIAGIAPTAAVGVALHEGLAGAGVVITASHNPASDNGFKLFGPGGTKLDDAQIRRAESWLNQDLPEVLAPGGAGAVEDAAAEVRARWLAAIRRAVPDHRLEVLRGRRLAVDLAHGALTSATGELLARAPADWVVIGGGDGEINDGAGTEHLERLSGAVRSHGCEGGFAVDGDGDRCRVVGPDGQEVPGDAVTWLLAKDLGVRALAVTVMSNAALERCLPGVRVVRTPVGDRHLLAAMSEEGLPLGAEESGHVLFADHPAGDGWVTGLRVLVAGLTAGSLATAFQGYRPLPRVQRKLTVRRRPDLEDVPAIALARAAGLARLGEGARVFLRYSGTEALLRVLVEGEDAEAVAEIADGVVEVARRELS